MKVTTKLKIKIVLLDIDGVVTNGKVLVDSQGHEIKQIDFKDLDGAYEIKKMGLKLGFVTKEQTPITEFFKERFQPDIFYNGVSDKLKVINKICKDFDIKKENICYMGDGKYDVEGVSNVGLGVCPANAIPEVKEVAQVVLSKNGGDGCVWELVEHLKGYMENNDFTDRLIEHINIVNKIKFDEVLRKNILDIVKVIVECYKKKGRVFLAGNGQSVSNARYIATELISGLYSNRPALDAECLEITTIGNDFSFDSVFSKQLERKAKQEDIFMGISVNGTSKNILNALITAKSQNTTTIVITGQNVSNDILNNTDYIINIPSSITRIIQECHIIIGNIICELVEKSLSSEKHAENKRLY